jgi:hypothetical protein
VRPPAGELGSLIFGTGLAKTQHADGAHHPRRRALPEAALCSESDLFDSNRKPSDQPCDLVQLLAILRLNGLRKPDETFVIAHRG